MKVVGSDSSLGTYETWMDQAAAQGDGYAQMDKALRLAMAAKDTSALKEALGYSFAAQNGNALAALVQLGLSIEQKATTASDREKSFFLYQLASRVAASDGMQEFDAVLRREAIDRAKALSNLLDGATVVKLYREARDWHP